MAKDRITFAKRQREVDQKRRADQKRERRARKKHMAEDAGESNKSYSALSPAEQSVLGVFKNYLLTPGKMFCFGSSDLEVFDAPLEQLIDKGLLIVEKPKGGYSLTQTGFRAMKAGA